MQHVVDPVEEDRARRADDHLVGVCAQLAGRRARARRETAESVREPVGDPGEILEAQDVRVSRGDGQVPHLARRHARVGDVGVEQPTQVSARRTLGAALLSREAQDGERLAAAQRAHEPRDDEVEIPVVADVDERAQQVREGRLAPHGRRQVEKPLTPQETHLVRGAREDLPPVRGDPHDLMPEVQKHRVVDRRDPRVHLVLRSVKPRGAREHRHGVGEGARARDLLRGVEVVTRESAFVVRTADAQGLRAHRRVGVALRRVKHLRAAQLDEVDES